MSKKIEDAAEGFVAKHLAVLFACAVSFAFGACFGLLF